MLNPFIIARAWLANVDPAAPAAALLVFVFAVIYSVRRWLPGVWLWVEKTVPFVDSFDYRPAASILWQAWQAWPAALLGAVTAALSTGGSVKAAAYGVLVGAISALAHKLMAAYKGQVGGPPPKPPAAARMFPSSIPPAAALLLAICFAFHASACGLFAAVSPFLAEAGVLIADATNAVNAADDLLPSLHLSGDAETKAEAVIAKTRKAINSAAAADSGAKDLTEAQLDASLAEFRASWADLQAVFAAEAPTAASANPLPVPLALRRVYK